MRPLFAQLIDVRAGFTTGWDRLQADFARNQVGMRTA